MGKVVELENLITQSDIERRILDVEFGDFQSEMLKKIETLKQKKHSLVSFRDQNCFELQKQVVLLANEVKHASQEYQVINEVVSEQYQSISQCQSILAQSDK